jgi:hypothetical protein
MAAPGPMKLKLRYCNNKETGGEGGRRGGGRGGRVVLRGHYGRPVTRTKLANFLELSRLLVI